MSWRIFHAGMTDVGRQRELNEDVLRVAPDKNLFIVIDGVSGTQGGEVVANLAADTLLDHFTHTSLETSTCASIERSLEEGLKLANRRIIEHVEAFPRHRASGAVAVAVVFDEDHAHVAHVGDARAYLYRGGKLRSLTRDHTWFNDLLASDIELTPEGIACAARYSTVVIRTLGMEASVEVDLGHVELEEGDLFLLCSDGLHDMIEDDEIADILARPGAMREVCDALIGAANDAGGEDNVTVIAISVQRGLDLTRGKGA